MPLFYARLLTPDKEIPPLVVVYLSHIALSVDFQGVMRELPNFDGINGIYGISNLSGFAWRTEEGWQGKAGTFPFLNSSVLFSPLFGPLCETLAC
jgi:hypothetical protein